MFTSPESTRKLLFACFFVWIFRSIQQSTNNAFLVQRKLIRKCFSFSLTSVVKTLCFLANEKHLLVTTLQIFSLVRHAMG